MNRRKKCKVCDERFIQDEFLRKLSHSIVPKQIMKTLPNGDMVWEYGNAEVKQLDL